LDKEVSKVFGNKNQQLYEPDYIYTGIIIINSAECCIDI